MNRRIPISFIAAFFIFCGKISGNGFRWNTEGGEWHNPESWYPVGVPGKNDTALFDNKTINKVIISKPVNIAKIKSTENVTAVFQQKAEVRIKKDFILHGGQWHAGDQSIYCGGDFLVEKKGRFNRGHSIVILQGTGQVAGYLFYKLEMAFKNHTTTLKTSIYPQFVKLNGGSLQSSTSGITFYTNHNPLSGFDSGTVNIKYLTMRPNKLSRIQLPSIKMKGKLFLKAIRNDAVYVVKNKLDIDGPISISGEQNGYPILELDGGIINATSIRVGDSITGVNGGLIRFLRGTMNLSKGIYLTNNLAVLCINSSMSKPDIVQNYGTVISQNNLPGVLKP